MDSGLFDACLLRPGGETMMIRRLVFVMIFGVAVLGVVPGRNLQGGMVGWRQQGDPLIGAPTR